jgi:hypothetical protein
LCTAGQSFLRAVWNCRRISSLVIISSARPHDYSSLDLSSLRARYHTGQATRGFVWSPWETIHAIRRGILDVRLPIVLWRCLRWSPLPARVDGLTKFAPLLLWVTAIKLSVTQGPWLISQDQLCSFQAVILHRALHRIFRGRDSMKCNQESHRSLFLHHPTHLA